MAVHGTAPGGANLIIVSAVFLVVATAMIVMRFVARRQSEAVGADDYMSLASYIFLIGVTVCHCLIGGPYGFAGWPSTQFSPQQLKQFSIMLYADNIFYTCCTASIKMSIVLLFRRIFVTPALKVITTSLLVILAMWWLAVLSTQIFSCTPVEGSWIPTKAKSCVDTIRFYNAVTISNVVFDFTLLVLPMPMIWRLHMSSKRKAQVSGVFFVGTFTCICSIMRTVMLQQLSTADITGTVWHAGIWTYIECAIGVSCSCMPPMAHLLRQLRKPKEAAAYRDGGSDSKQSIKLSNLSPGSGTTTNITGPNSQSKGYLELP